MALIAAAVLHALTCLLLTTSLPRYVPVLFDESLEPAVAAPRSVATALALGSGIVVAGAAALVAARSRRPLRADRVRHLGAVSVLLLTFEAAAVYGALGGAEVASWTGADAASYASASIAVEGFQRAGGRLPTTALVVAAVYLAYLVTWAVVVRRGRRVGVDQPS
ncbi:hypothetical protein [Klenkia sp. PcliD-1-E]|uniref:hypothetical protein n=1 Tax=Klenkia sp. PcliD-1-E TaxID=2954492 RepID=UPI002096BC6B|nr:hypothetical protein [Klenkia sp. PcliD-1-E]